MRTLQTERLALVPVNASNSETLWHLLQAPHLRDFQELPSVGLAQFKRLVAERPQRLHDHAAGRFEWLMFVRGEDEPIGWVSLRLSDRDPVGGEVGYSVLERARGKGYATEASRALIAEGFSRANLKRVRAYCLPENVASRAVLAKLGFASDGLLRHGATIAGRPVDILAFVFERQPACTSR
ncbi:MAG TPA: GNAT family N-acetyltransferase [Candidatus Baltobacteraceae bacterium]|jgi:ribosomal-protein-alanine N-acetyltransferase